MSASRKGGRARGRGWWRSLGPARFWLAGARRLLGLVGLLVFGPNDILGAQTAGCPSDTTTSGRICLAGVDGLTALLPVEGLLASGGNPVPGTAAGIGKFGHVRLSARIGLASITLPDARYDGVADTVPADKHILVPAPRLDVALGIFGKPLPIGRATVDLLGSAILLPTTATSRIIVDPNARKIGDIALGLGYGVRIGMAMAPPKPVVSLSVMKRDLPTLRFGRLPNDRVTVASNLSAINARLMVGARFSVLSLSAGGGIDLYKGTGSVTYQDSAAARDSTVPVSYKSSRIVTVVNAAFDLRLLSFWAEGGFQIGKDDGVTTTFEGNDPKSGRFFAGFGFAFQL